MNLSSSSKLLPILIGCCLPVIANAEAAETCLFHSLGVIGSGADLKPLEKCKPGDIIHLQVNTRNVLYSRVAATMCDFEREILIEPSFKRNRADEIVQDLEKTNVVCVYQWKSET